MYKFCGITPMVRKNLKIRCTLLMTLLNADNILTILRIYALGFMFVIFVCYHVF